MTALELLTEKINILKENLDKLNTANLDEKAQLQAQLEIIDECEKAMSNEDIIANFDFSSAIQLMKNYNYSIENLAKIISDIKNVIKVRNDFNLSKEAFPLEESQIKTLSDFINSLQNLKEKINYRITKLVLSIEEKQRIEKLEALKDVFAGIGRRKYVTTDMFEAFYKEFPLLKMPEEEANIFIDAFYQTRNLSTRQGKEKADFNAVVELYSEFVSPRFQKKLIDILNDHKNEIIANIDMDNAREILQFFKEKAILNRFKINALVKIVLYGNPDYIKDYAYPEIMSKSEDDIKPYFEDQLSTLWIKEKNTEMYRNRPFRITRGRGDAKDKETLYSTCHTVNLDEYQENIEILRENRDLFGDKIDIDDPGANLKIKTLPVWILKKDLALCKLFNIGNITSITISLFEKGDIEDKIHLAIELGLLNSPMSQKFLDIDTKIVRNDEFQKNMKRRRLYNQSIRNYFQRYSSMLSTKTINEYALITNKLSTLGYVQFYNEFFSSAHAGKGNDKFISEQYPNFTPDKKQMDDFVASNFMTEWFSDFISNYDEYDNIISEYIDSYKKDGYKEEYFDQSILDDELIQYLEDNHTIMDIIQQNDQTIERKNEFVYLFGDRIISRYKVLHNATILKGLYNKFTKEMLMTSIVRNSFIDADSFQLIYTEIMERGKLL